jgi:hypothetical protein
MFVHKGLESPFYIKFEGLISAIYDQYRTKETEIVSKATKDYST